MSDCKRKGNAKKQSSKNNYNFKKRGKIKNTGS